MRQDGLITSHAYTITKLATVTYNGKEKKLIRCLFFT
ncbi:MAG: hypothetical protein ACK559_41335 [bacterium]